MQDGDFVGQYTRLMTTEEKQAFMNLLDVAMFGAGIKPKFIEVEPDGDHNSYYGHSSTVFNAVLPKTIAFKKGQDTIYGVNRISFLVQPQLGYKTYEELQDYKLKHGQRGFGVDDFTSFQWSVHIRTDGKHHEYRRHHSNDFPYEGDNHYHYNTEMSEFLTPIIDYLKENIPPTDSWK